MNPIEKAIFSNYDIDNAFIVRTPYWPLKYQGPIQESAPPQTAIRKWWSDIPFRRAVQHATPGFALEIQRWLDKKNPKKSEQIWYSLMKYRIRMCTRATPFGHFAGPSLGNFGQTTGLVREGPQNLDRHTLVHLHHIPEGHKTGHTANKKTLWFPNTTLYSSKMGHRYWEFPETDSGLMPILREVSGSTALSEVLKKAANGAAIPHLLGTLTKIEHSKELAEAYLEQLSAQKVLVPDSTPSIFEPKLKVDIPNKERSAAKAVDLYPRFQATTLDHSIKEQVWRALWISSLFTAARTDANYAKFSRAFASLFGNRKQRLVDVMDGEYGLGYPLGRYREANSYLKPFGLSSKESETLQKSSSAQQWLWKKWATNPDGEALYLDSNDLMGFDMPNFGFRQTFFGLVEWVSLNGTSFCHPISFGGASAAVLHARHAVEHPEFMKWAISLAAKENPRDQDAIAMEVAYRPQGKEAMVTIRPQLRESVLHLNNGRRQEDSHTIALDSLLLHHDETLLVLTHKASGKIVQPYLTTAHDHHRSPLALYRFLGDHQFLGMHKYAHFDWGTLPEGNLCLPRVIHKDILLAKRMWRFSMESVRQLQRNSQHPKQFADHWQDFCLKYHLTKKLTWAQHDQRLVLDTKATNFIRLFVKRLPLEGPLVLEEYLPPGEPLVRDAHGHTYASEFQFSFLRKTEKHG